MARSEALFGALLLALGGCSLVLDADDHRDGVVADGGGRDMTVRDDMSSPDMNGPGDDMSVPDMSIPDDMPGVDLGPPGGDCDVLQLTGGTATTADGVGLNGLETLTVEAWVRPAAGNSGNRNIVGHWGTFGTDGGFALFLADLAPSFAVSTDGAMTFFVTASAPISMTEWTHIAGTWERGRYAVFVNGTPAGEDTVAAATTTSVIDRPLQLGYDDPNAGNPFRGFVDEVRVSRTVRYPGSNTFVPERRFSGDADTWALYHFDPGARAASEDDDGHDLELDPPPAGVVAVRLTGDCRPLDP